MTISNQTNKNQYEANGSNTSFGYGFKINASSEVVVLVTDTAGSEVEQVETTDYTVTGVGDGSGGNVIFVTAPTNLYTVTLLRGIPLTQTTDYIDNAAFAAAAHEDGLDRTIMVAQKQQEEIDRSLKILPSSDVTFSPEINLTSGASKYLRVTSDESGFELVDSVAASGAGLASVDGVSNSGGNVDFVSGDGTVTITPNDGANTVDFSASASQPFATLSGVSNAGGNVAIVNGSAMTVTADDGANTITIAFNASGVTANSISGNAVDGGIISNFASTGIDDNTTSNRVTVTDAAFTTTANSRVENAAPHFTLDDTNGASDAKNMRLSYDAGVFSVLAFDDAESGSTIPLRILRTGTAIDEFEVNATLLDFNGNIDMSGTVDCSGTESFKVPVGTTAQRPSSPTNGDTRYNTTTNKLESYINATWEDIATGTGTGETNLAANVGVGTGNVFKDKTGVTLNMKTLIGGTNITVTDNVDDITITAAGTVGEANTTSNAGAGAGQLAQAKAGVNLPIKTIKAGAGVTVTNNANDVEIAIASSAVFDVTANGATGDGTTDDTAAINTTITALLAGTRGGILYFPAGEYKISSKLTITLTGNNESVIIKGDGEELTQLSFTGAIDGIEIVLGGGFYEGDKAIAAAQDFSMETDTVGGQVGLKFTGSAGSLAPIKRVKNVVFSGHGSTVTYWGTALNYDECTFTEVESCQFQGNVGSGTPSWFGIGISISGAGTAVVDHFISNCKFHSMDTAIKVSENVEGVYVNKIAAVNVMTGINWNTVASPAAEPLLTVIGSHISAASFCITLTRCSQFLISSNLLYGNSAATGAWVGIAVNTTSAIAAGGNISDNIIVATQATTPKNGIVLALADYHMINGNSINGVETGVWLQTGSDNNVVLDNYVTSFSSNSILDSGSNNVIRAYDSVSSFRGALVYLTALQTVPNSPTNLTVSWHAEDHDTSLIWTITPNPTRLTVPTGVTRVRLSAQLDFTAHVTGRRRLDITKNGGGYNGRTRVSAQTSSSGTTVINASTPVLTVTGGDYFEVQALQDSGANLDLRGTGNTWFAMEIVE